MISSAVRILMIFCIVAMCGCVNNSALFAGPRGKIIRCSSTGFGYIGAPLASMSFSKCKEDAATMGYLPLEDAGFVGIILKEQQVNGENIIARVIDGSPSYKSDIMPGDAILTVKGQKPAGIDDLYNLMFGKKNEPVDISIMHEGQERNITLVRAPREIQKVSSKD